MHQDVIKSHSGFVLDDRGSRQPAERPFPLRAGPAEGDQGEEVLGLSCHGLTEVLADGRFDRCYGFLPGLVGRKHRAQSLTKSCGNRAHTRRKS